MNETITSSETAHNIKVVMQLSHLGYERDLESMNHTSTISKVRGYA